MVCLNFEIGRITTWVKVSGGVVHRVREVDNLDSQAMREAVYDREVVERFREGPDSGGGGEATFEKRACETCNRIWTKRFGRIALVAEQQLARALARAALRPF